MFASCLLSQWRCTANPENTVSSVCLRFCLPSLPLPSLPLSPIAVAFTHNAFTYVVSSAPTFIAVALAPVAHSTDAFVVSVTAVNFTSCRSVAFAAAENCWLLFSLLLRFMMHSLLLPCCIIYVIILVGLRCSWPPVGLFIGAC